jgi:hypothetical protein
MRPLFTLTTTLTLFLAMTASAVASDTADKTSPETGTCTTSNLRVREQPSLSAAVLGYLNPGDVVHITDQSHDAQTIDGIASPWYQVDHIGWVFGGYLKLASMDTPKLNTVVNGRMVARDLKPQYLKPYDLDDEEYAFTNGETVHYYQPLKRLYFVAPLKPSETLVKVIDPSGREYNLRLAFDDVQKASGVDTYSVHFRGAACFVAGKWKLVVRNAGNTFQYSFEPELDDVSVATAPIFSPLIDDHDTEPHKATRIYFYFAKDPSKTLESASVNIYQSTGTYQKEGSSRGWEYLPLLSLELDTGTSNKMILATDWDLGHAVDYVYSYKTDSGALWSPLQSIK